MAYRNIFISNEARLRLRNKQLIVDNGEELSFPIEDIQRSAQSCFQSFARTVFASLSAMISTRRRQR